MSKQPHLSELFQAGKLFSFTIANYSDPERPLEYELWFQHPHPMQREEAMTKARAKQARKRMLLSDKEGDQYLSLWQSVLEVGGVEQLADRLADWDLYSLRQKAYHEVLYSDEVGSDWGKEGQVYIDLVAAIQSRIDEIVQLNEGLSDEDQHQAIVFEEDRELQLLREEQEKFESEVEDQMEAHLSREKARLKQHSTEELRQMLLKKLIDSEASLAWMGEYKVQMVRYVVRYPDDHKKFYFSDVEAIWDLPDHVRTQIFAAYDEFERDGDDLKNLLSLQPS